MLTKELLWSCHAHRRADFMSDNEITELLYNGKTHHRVVEGRHFGYKRLALCIAHAPGVFMDADLRKARNIFVNMRTRPMTIIAKHLDKVLLQRIIFAQKAIEGISEKVR